MPMKEQHYDPYNTNRCPRANSWVIQGFNQLALKPPGLASDKD